MALENDENGWEYLQRGWNDDKRYNKVIALLGGGGASKGSSEWMTEK